MQSSISVVELSMAFLILIHCKYFNLTTKTTMKKDIPYSSVVFASLSIRLRLRLHNAVQAVQVIMSFWKCCSTGAMFLKRYGVI